MADAEARLYTGLINSLADIPADESNQIKIFLSSNETDFYVERDAIISQVIPKLREETKSKYGLELHFMDLMYGTESPDMDDFSAREFRLKELLRAQNLSAGPNFVSLIGQKYGNRPVPQLILSEIYDLIHTALLNSSARRARNVNLISKWYIQDENSIPAVHVLKPAKESNTEIWLEEKPLLQQVLMYGVELCCKDGTLPPETLKTYFASELENEVKHGLMSASDGCSLVFERTITDLSNYANEEAVNGFIETVWNDVEECWQICTDNQQLRDAMKSDIVEANVRVELISRYSILWRYDSGVHPVFHKDYINQLSNDMSCKLRELISDAAAVIMSRRNLRSRLHNEVIRHWRKAAERGSDCHGRDEDIAMLVNYLNNPHNREFFTIYGETGSGKTCLISKLLLEVKTYLPASTITIARFLGLTQESSDLRDMLYNLCQQILRAMNKEETIPTDFSEVLKFFNSLLNEIPSNINMVLLLDSLNSLLPDFNAHQLQWLPAELPPNVKIIVSCLPHSHGMFNRIKTEIIVRNHDNFLEMQPLGVEKAMLLLLHWLQKENMCITNTQVDILKEAFTSCSLPLYLKMVFHHVKQWRSFDSVDKDCLGTSCDTLLDAMFTNLENKHGQTTVKHAIAYLTASKTGLSDMEMEDMLSLDDEVLTEISRRGGGSTVMRRCPPSVWAKIRNDIESLLHLTSTDDFDVYYWFHGLITSYTERRYLSDESFLRQIHHMIADYYLGVWHQKPKKYVDDDGKEQQEDRKVLSQPLTYTNILGETQYNRRKYDQVPRHLFLANRLDELNAKVMFNYEWLYNKIKVLSLQHILADLSLNPSVEATLLEGALRSAQPILDANINNMPVELSGRLLPYYQTYPLIQSLIDQCDTAGLVHCSLVPMFNYHEVPGSPLQYTFKYTEQINDMCTSSDSKFVIAKAHNSQLVRKFDLRTGEIDSDIIASYGAVSLSPDDKHLVIVDNEIEKAVKIHTMKNGAYLFQLIPIKFIDMQDNRKYNLGPLSISSRYIAILITTDTTYLCIASFQEQDFVKVIHLKGKGNVVQISKNQSYVLCNVGHNVLAFSLSTFEQICLTQLEYKPSCLTMNNASSKAFITAADSPIVTVTQLSPDGYTQMVSKISLQRYFRADRIIQTRLSHNGTLLLVRGDETIVVYNTATDKLVLQIRRPPSIMSEFRLPKHHQPTKITYTDSIFSHDDSILMTSLFRNIQFWDLATGSPMTTTILAPVGIITHILQSPTSGQIISVQQDTDKIQVWNLKDYIMDVTSLDRLTSPIESLALTEDNRLCFATGSGSDEVGVIDMTTGLLTNLLTHESEVTEITAVSDGSFLFVSLNPSKTEFCNKIWSVSNREIVKEFGRYAGLTVALRKSNTILHIAQTSTSYQAPYAITTYTFENGMCQESSYEFIINHAISKPIVTAEDTYMVLLTADRYLENEARYSNPSICTLYLKGRYMHNIIGKNDLSPFLDNRHIVSLVPIPNNSTQVIALYKPSHNGMVSNDGSFGFVCIDLATSTILRYSDNFMPSSTELRNLYLTHDGSRCVNADLGLIFAMNSGERVGTVTNHKSRLVLLENGAMAAYYHGSNLIVERLSDNAVIAECNVHMDICFLGASNDDRTMIVGCTDGTVLSYVLIDPQNNNPKEIVAGIASRQSEVQNNEYQTIANTDRRPKTAPDSIWDQCDTTSLASNSRPSSTISLANNDREILKQIRPVYRSMTAAARPSRNSSSGYQSLGMSHDRSKTCLLM